MRPRLLDLFCGGGGSAMGYHRAGFEVMGVDIRPQPRYPFTFVQGDALEHAATLHRDEFDVIHASPPCQAYSRATAWRGDRANHPDLIGQVRRLLVASGLPFVIETVEDGRGHLLNPTMLCGSMFGLSVKRHRYFEGPLPVWSGCACRHGRHLAPFDHGGTITESDYRDAMGCEWMLVREAREAIPPAYTEWVGERLIALLTSDG